MERKIPHVLLTKSVLENVAYTICKHGASSYQPWDQAHCPLRHRLCVVSGRPPPWGSWPGTLTAGTGGADCALCRQAGSPRREEDIWTPQTQFLFPNVSNPASSRNRYGRRRPEVLFWRGSPYKERNTRSEEMFPTVSPHKFSSSEMSKLCSCGPGEGPSPGSPVPSASLHSPALSPCHDLLTL